MSKPTDQPNFLPDLCDARYVLIIVLLSELFALTVWLASFAHWPLDWVALGKISMFVQWVSLASAFVICMAQHWLRGWRPLAISLFCLAVVFTTTLLTSALAHYYFPSTNPFAIQAFRNVSIATILSALVFHYLYLRQIHLRDTAAKHKATIEALQARIRPHFLFNCLNTIAALIRHAPEQAEQTVEDLADLFRASIAEVDTIVALEEEFDLIERYLRIENVRVGERLHVKWDVEPLRNQQIKLPLLSIQPIVENAIYHGVEQIPEGGTITIIGYIEQNNVMIEVSNPIPKQARHNRQSLHIAVDNTRQRLQLAFKGKASLTLTDDSGMYVVTLKLPLHGHP